MTKIELLELLEASLPDVLPMGIKYAHREGNFKVVTYHNYAWLLGITIADTTRIPIVIDYGKEKKHGKTAKDVSGSR